MPHQYFTDVYEAFERAVVRTADIRHYYRLGPDILCLRFAGHALISSLAPAFAHLATSPCAQPSLTIVCWDSSSTTICLPKPPLPLRSSNAQGHVPGYNNDFIRTVFQPGVNILTMFNTHTHTGIYWVQHPGGIPYWERSSPMRGLFHWWCASMPLQLVHAGAVGTEQGGVLLTGKSGAGKSVSALACLTSSLDYAGDDYVLIGTGPTPYVYSLYSTGKLVPESLAMLPRLQDSISNALALGHQKALFFLQEHYPQKLRSGFPIKAIFLPKVTHSKDTRLRSASSLETLLAMAPTTVLTLEGDSRLAFGKMARLVKSLPHYWLELGTDVSQIPEVISRFLEQT